MLCCAARWPALLDCIISITDDAAIDESYGVAVVFNEDEDVEVPVIGLPAVPTCLYRALAFSHRTVEGRRWRLKMRRVMEGRKRE